MKTKYFAKIRNQSFTVAEIGWTRCIECNGSGRVPGIKKDDNCPKCKGTGQVIGRIPMIGVDGSHKILNGERVYLDKTLSFTNIVSSHTAGFLSEYIVYKDEEGHSDTPDEVVKALNECVRHPYIDVYTEDGYDKDQNPQRYEEKKKREAIEKKLASAERDKTEAVAKAVKETEAIHGKALKEMQEKVDKLEKEQTKKG